MRHPSEWKTKWLLRRLLLKFFSGQEFNARTWSNGVLRQIAPHLTGTVLNVSGGNDQDKEGARYCNYFSNAQSYSVSNYGALSGLDNEFSLDLEVAELPSELQGAFDVVFNHTVLEHVYDLGRALGNLAALSRDVIISVVPFLQSYHHGAWYDDYWRFTPTVMDRLLHDQGLQTIYLDWNDDPLGNLYIVHVAARDPGRHASIAGLQKHLPIGPGYARSLAIYGNAGLEHAGIELAKRHPDGGRMT